MYFDFETTAPTDNIFDSEHVCCVLRFDRCFSFCAKFEYNYNIKKLSAFFEGINNIKLPY